MIVDGIDGLSETLSKRQIVIMEVATIPASSLRTYEQDDPAMSVAAVMDMQ